MQNIKSKTTKFTATQFSNDSITSYQSSFQFHSDSNASFSVILTQPIQGTTQINITLKLQDKSSTSISRQPVIPTKESTKSNQLPQQRLQDPRKHIKHQIPQKNEQQLSHSNQPSQKFSNKLVGGVFIGVVNSSKSNAAETYETIMNNPNSQCGIGLQLCFGPPTEQIDSAMRQYINSSICSTGLKLNLKYDVEKRKLYLNDLGKYFKQIRMPTCLESVRIFIATRKSDVMLEQH